MLARCAPGSGSSLLLWSGLVVAVCLTAPPVAAQSPATPQPAATTRTAAQVYAAACAHCHGPDGRGGSADRLALPVPLPDFTDCQFAPREPDSDWAAVVHDGGPARAFHRTMPAFSPALTDDEVQQAINHLRTFCGEPAWPRGELNFPKALVTEKAFPEDELIVITSIATEGEGAVSSKVIYEKRIGARNQVEFVVPVAAHARGTGGWQGGVGDVAFAVKRVLAANRDRGSIVSLTNELVLPTRSATLGAGNGRAVYETFLTYGQALPSDAFLQFQGGFGLPMGGEAASEGFWRATIGRTFAQGRWGRAWSPMVEFLGSREFEEGQKVSWDILPQVQVSLTTRQHVLLNMGLRVPVTDRGPRKTQFVVYLLWDWFDGGFFQGW